MTYPSHTSAYRKKYRVENRDVINAQYRAAYRNNPKIKARMIAAYDSDAAHEQHVRDPRGRMVTMAKHRARLRGLPFNITVADILIPEFCPALGIKLSVGRLRKLDNSPTIDRIVPSRGYVKGNVVVISYKANRIKNDASVSELRMVSSWLESIIAGART